MIAEIISYINESIESTELIRTLHSLCELQTKDKQTFPCEYLSNGEFSALKLDNSQSEIYHRHNGSVSRSNKAKAIVGCDAAIEKNYPMLLIGFMPRIISGRDHAFIPDDVCEVISNAIDERVAKSLTKTLGAMTTSINVNGYSVDGETIFAREFKGTETTLDPNYFMFEISYDVLVLANESCFKEWCDMDSCAGERQSVSSQSKVVTVLGHA